jgi:exodeoxyribonuclease VII large subunit
VDKQLTLSELNELIKETLNESFSEQLWVVAEIGELNINRAGHCYIELVEKDLDTNKIKARTRATIWSWQFRFIKPYFEQTTGQPLMAGIKILASVTVEYHEVYGLSLNIKDIDPTYTLGDIARKRKEIIDQLIEDGVFDMNKEIPLPDIPSRIAIISSPTAAGYEDFINQLHHNSNGYRFYTKLFAANMQGDQASESIIYALDTIYEYDQMFDLVVIIRGGGSQMDLSCFDNYELAQHVAQFPLPVLTGIGHEKDESITDMVAHTKLKTPTAVAEFLIGRFDLIAQEISQLESDFFNEIDELLLREKTRINHALQLFKPLLRSKIENTTLKLQHLSESVKPLIDDQIDQQQDQLSRLAERILSGSTTMLKENLNKTQHLTSKISFLGQLKTGNAQQVLNEKEQQLHRITINRIKKETEHLEWLEKNKRLLDPKTILKRGFSITMINGKAIKNSSTINEGDQLETIFYQGKVKSTVKEKQIKRN